jgi:hypothetical protein
LTGLLQIVKLVAKYLYVQDIASYRNQKGVWGVISQGACDAKAKVRFVQSDWPGEAKK